LPQFKLIRPRSVAEAVAHLAAHGDNTRIVAGGTDLIPSLRQKLFAPDYVLDVRHIAELKGIQTQGKCVTIGALTPLSALEHSPFLREHFPVLTQAAATVASPVIRNMGTIGGNICLNTRCLWYNQSLTWRKSCGFCIKKDGDICHVAPGGTKCWAAFSGDTPPALLCLNAEVEVLGPAGTRRVGLRDFYTGIGDNYRKLQANELLTRIFLPEASADLRGSYSKLRIRGSIDYPLAGVAVAVRRTNGHIADARVALTAVNPAPVLLKGVSELLAGKQANDELAAIVGDIAARTAKPLTTSALTPEYRREMIRVFTRRAILAASAN
jgi:4-hydroxybenzoyl-CoA reductase subunit beta